MEQRLVYAVERLGRAAVERVEREEHRFIRLVDKLDMLSPLSVMKRGYSLVYADGRKKLVRSLQDVQPSDPIQVRLQDGWLECQIWGIQEEKKTDE